MMATKTIRISCKGAALVPISTLENFQGSLKTLMEKQYEKLRHSIEEHGFSFPIAAWQSGKRNHIIDGHQRLFTVNKMLEEGWTLPGKRLPVDWIEAKSKKEAKAKVLLAASQYGRYDEDSVYEFVSMAGLDFPELKLGIDLPQIHMGKLEVGWFKDEEKPGEAADDVLTDVFNVIIDCETEQKQLEILDRLQREGYKCRALVS